MPFLFKWTPQVGFTLRFLGYLLDTRTMTVQWPEDKRAQLAAMLDDDWQASSLEKKIPDATKRAARTHPSRYSCLGDWLLPVNLASLNDAIRAQDLRGKVTK